MLAWRYSSEMYRIGVRAFSTSFQRQAKESFQFLVVGAGSGGLSISSTLCRKFPHATAIIEPSELEPTYPPGEEPEIQRKLAAKAAVNSISIEESGTSISARAFVRAVKQCQQPMNVFVVKNLRS